MLSVSCFYKPDLSFNPLLDEPLEKNIAERKNKEQEKNCTQVNNRLKKKNRGSDAADKEQTILKDL